MTTVRFPALDPTPTGSAQSIAVTIDLIGANGRSIVGALTPDGAAVTCGAVATLSYDADDDQPAAPVDVDLTPQSAIVAPDGGATYYRVTLASETPDSLSVWRVQVPDSDATVLFGDLLAGAAVSPADLAGGRLLPLTTDADAGDALVLVGPGKTPTWSPAGAGGGCVTLACLTDGPGDLGTPGQALVVAADGETWDWATPTAAAAWGAITGTLASQSDLSAALGAKEATGTAAAAVAAHVAASDPHTGYRLESASVPWADLSGVPASFTPSTHASAHAEAGADPVTVTLGQIAQSGATSGQVPKWSGTAWAPADDSGGSGGGATNLAVANKTSTTLDLTSDTGTDATIPAADATYAGLLTAAGFTKLSGIAAGATAEGAAGDAFASSHLSAFTHSLIATALQPAAIGTTVQGYSSNLADLAGYTHGSFATATQGSHADTAWGWGNHASAGYLTSVTYGTTAGTACQGNDSRLSDARAPTAHASSHAAAGSDAITVTPGQITQAGATSGQVLAWSGSAWAPATASGSASPEMYCGCRLSVSATEPVPSSATTSTTLYLVAATSGVIQLYTGSAWASYTGHAVSKAIGTVTADLPYDVFAYLDSGSPALELVAWTNATTRATAIAYASGANGRAYKSGDMTRLYIGTVLPSSTTEVTDSETHRGVWNYYNRTAVLLKPVFPSASHTYTTGSFREFNNGTDVTRTKFVTGIAQAIPVGMRGYMRGSHPCRIGVAFDSVAAAGDSATYLGYSTSADLYFGTGGARVTAAGGHYLTAVEIGGSSAVFQLDSVTGVMMA